MDKKRKLMGSSRERSEFLWGWLFILPTMVGLIILNLIPIFQTIYQSFFKTGDFGRGNIFVGLDNYVKVFGDKEVWQALIKYIKICDCGSSVFHCYRTGSGSSSEQKDERTFCI